MEAGVKRERIILKRAVAARTQAMHVALLILYSQRTAAHRRELVDNLARHVSWQTAEVRVAQAQLGSAEDHRRASRNLVLLSRELERNRSALEMSEHRYRDLCVSLLKEIDEELIVLQEKIKSVEQYDPELRSLDPGWYPNI